MTTCVPHAMALIEAVSLQANRCTCTQYCNVAGTKNEREPHNHQGSDWKIDIIEENKTYIRGVLYLYDRATCRNNVPTARLDNIAQRCPLNVRPDTESNDTALLHHGQEMFVWCLGHLMTSLGVWGSPLGYANYQWGLWYFRTIFTEVVYYDWYAVQSWTLSP